MASNEQLENNSRQVKSLDITPDLTDVQADLLGVMGFSFEMNKKLAEVRALNDPVKKGWHRPDSEGDFSTEEYKEWAKRCIEENRFVDAANLLMMAYYKEKRDEK